ncbi:ABC transporter permease subunit [Streptomyces sioyaensis]|uniref:ABC transporter permease subunit n=1 Tax=Streptomyces sioyaensis TaxID=67364 RepID=UPI003799BAC2
MSSTQSAGNTSSTVHMSETSGTSNASTTSSPTTAPRGILHGLPWVVWRRHRATLLTGLAITVVGCALFAYQRIGVMDFLNAKGTLSNSKVGDLADLILDFNSKIDPTFSRDSDFLKFVPAVVGVFLGAPLIAREQERGTIKLVMTQSVGRGRWIAATLGVPLAFVALCTTLLTVAFTWLWSPAHELASGWLGTGPFETTGPVPVAMTLFVTACGIALGMLFKRVITAMAATAALALVTALIWSDQIRGRLATPRSAMYPYGSDGHIPYGAEQVDWWAATADGKRFDKGTCYSYDQAADVACRAKLGIVNRVTQYFDYGQMAGMQWLGAGILLALTAVVLAFVVWRARRRPL